MFYFAKRLGEYANTIVDLLIVYIFIIIEMIITEEKGA